MPHFAEKDKVFRVGTTVMMADVSEPIYGAGGTDTQVFWSRCSPAT
jgi:hypothetical protein